MLFRISISDGAIFKLEEGLVFRNKSWSFVTGYSNRERMIPSSGDEKSVNESSLPASC